MLWAKKVTAAEGLQGPGGGRGLGALATSSQRGGHAAAWHSLAIVNHAAVYGRVCVRMYILVLPPPWLNNSSVSIC